MIVNSYKDKRAVLLSAMSLLFADMADIIVRKSRSLTLQGEQLKVLSMSVTLLGKAYKRVNRLTARSYALLSSATNNAITGAP